MVTLFTDAQSLSVNRFAEEEGLPSPLVKSITRDKFGIIWAATDDGLVSFDGREFRIYQEEFPSTYCKAVTCLPDGSLLVSSDQGVTRVSGNPAHHEFQVIGKGSVHRVDSLMWFPKLFYLDQSGNTWLGDNSRIYRLSNNHFKPYKLGPEMSTNNYNRSFSFVSDGAGHLYAFSETGYVLLYDPATDRFLKLSMPQKLSSVHAAFNISKETILIAAKDGIIEMKVGSNGMIISMRNISSLEVSFFARNSKSVVYFGTWAEGLFRIERTMEGEYGIQKIEEYTEKNVTHIFIDEVDNIWVSSDNGIMLLQETLFGSPFKNLTNSYIQSVACTKSEVVFTDGQKVFGVESNNTSPGKELLKCQSLVLQALPVSNGYWLSDANGSIWLCDKKGRLIHSFDFRKNGNAVFRLLQDHSGNIWACQDANNNLICITPDFRVKSYGPARGLTSRIISLGISPKGKIYGGGMHDSAFLFRYDEKTDRFENLSQPLHFERNIDINLNDIACPNENEIWLATSFGLVHFSQGNMDRVNLRQYTANSIKAIAIDKLGYIWFANNKGLHRFKDGDLMSFDEKNGLPAKAIGYRSIVVDGMGRLWAGTSAGLAVSPILTEPAKTQQPRIRSILKNNDLVDPKIDEALEICNKDVVKITIASPEFPIKNIRYERWITGIDRTWIKVENDAIVTISEIPPGKYLLKIRARQVGNYCYSEPVLFTIRVNLIWYERWWVIAIILLAFFGVIRVTMYYYSRKLRNDNQRLEEGIRQRTHEILQKNEQIEFQNADIIHKNEALSLKNLELEQAKNYAEEAVKAKAQFLSIMSHEIRTPMNAVIGITHLLMRNQPRPEQLEDLKILKFSAENLLGLINDVLDLNKIEAGKLELEFIDFNLRNLVEGITSSLHYKANEKGIELNFYCDPNLPDFIISDPLRLAQILNNLVGNAIKFTSQGGVEVAVKMLKHVVNEFEVEFSVTDTGVGIPLEMHAKIFDSFTQASSETSRKYGGTGLGLTISDHLASMLGTRIELLSEPGKGTKFFFILHMAKGGSKSESEKVDFVPDDQHRFNQQKVLLVEDNKINEIIARKLMEEWNLIVETAYNGVEAVEKTSVINFDLILMDLQMPEMDGYQTTAAIRDNMLNANHSVPIIALTASSRNEIHEKVLKSGMNDYVLKPFDPNDLFQKIRSFLG
ncbi:MAG: response regulator [Bacteroidetes bacterium]|nr:response regulator [Bacteroidota bacterium]